MKLKELMEARSIFVQRFNDKMSAGTAYKIMKIIKASNDDADFFDAKVQEILNEFGQKDESGKLTRDKDGNIAIAPDKLMACNQKLQELNDTEVEYEVKQTFALDELSELKLTPRECYVLDEYIKQ